MTETTFVCDFNCVGYWKRSDVTCKETQPLFGIDEITDMLAGAKWFSALDFASCYWQVKVCLEDRSMRALTIPFYVIPFQFAQRSCGFLTTSAICTRI
ncbi:RNA-directed DNA polymerase -like protein [Trichinella pseudospiralis]|uniref:RNA-directed DNA polymerase-like protein n=1 Tax=Trichinella pseudospiralis TaxID=6337 RepID=A0A0V1G6G1_TRIPS|nr:RNA-directed DNA polymerase -like protein [Trichinella pseudospiralis]